MLPHPRTSLLPVRTALVFTAFVSALVVLPGAARAAAFAPGSLIAYRVGDGVTAVGTSAAPVYLDEYAPDGTLIQSLALPTAAAGANSALTATSKGSEGLLSRTADGSCLVVPGYSVSVGTAAAAANATPRALGFVSAAGIVDTTTALGTVAFAGTSATVGTIRSAVADTCQRAWVGGTAAVKANQGIWFATRGAKTATQIYAAAAPQGLGLANQQLYASLSALDAVGSGLPTVATGSVTALSSAITQANIRGLAFLRLQAGSSAADTLYLADNVAGAVAKFTLVNGAWVAAGSLALPQITAGTSANSHGLLAVNLGDGKVALYASDSNAGRIYRAIDASGPTGTLAPSASSFQVFATAAGQPTSALIYGLAAAPLNALPGAAPGLPGFVLPSAVGASSFQVNWTAPVGGTQVEGYVLEISPGDSTFSAIAQTLILPATASSAVVNGVNVGSANPVWYRLRAINSAGASADQTAGVDLPQLISFGPAPSLTVGSSGSIGVTASSGLPVALGSLTPAVCSVSGTDVSGLAAGTCTLAADQAGNSEYQPAPTQTVSFTVGGVAQAISFLAAPTGLVVGGNATLAAVASSGLPILYGSATPAICTVNANTVTGLAAGTCIATADQAGNASYLPAAEATQSFAVAPGPQTIRFGTPPALAVRGIATLSAVASSGLAVGFRSVTPLICTVSSNMVSGLTAGLCTIVASQPGDANYSAAPDASQDVNVAQAAQTITFSSLPTLLVGASGTLRAQSGSGLPVSFGSATPDVCVVSGSLVTALAPGVCTVLADQSGDANNLPASTASQSFNLDGQLAAFLPGDLVVSAVQGPNLGGANLDAASPILLQQFTLDASGRTAARSGALILPQQASADGRQWPVSGELGSASEGILQSSADGLYLAIMGYGVVADAFNANGAIAYGNAALGQSTSLPIAAQTVPTFVPVPRVVARIAADTSIDTSTALFGLYNQNNPRSVASVDGTAFWTSGQGQTTSDPSQGVAYATLGASTATPVDNSTDTRVAAIVDAGNGNALWVSRDRKPASGANNFTYIGILAAPDGTLPSTASGLVTTHAVPPATPLSLGGNNGSVNLTAATANGVNNARIGSFVYLSPEQFFLASPDVLYVADSGQPKAGSTNAAGLGAGGLQKWIRVNGAWSLAYDLVNGLNLANNAGADAATPTAPGVTGLIGLTGRVVAGKVQLFATSYGLNELSQSYLYTITDELAATTPDQVAGEQFSVLFTDPSGQTMLRGVAFAPGLAQQISLAATPAVGVGGSVELVAFGGASGNPVTLVSLTPAVCSVHGSALSGVSSGTCRLALDQAGNSLYRPAPELLLSLTVGGAAQTLDFAGLPPLAIGESAGLAASASSGLAVLFASTTPAVCAVNGSRLTALSLGVCTVLADQPGNASYAAAPEIIQSIQVSASTSGGPGGTEGGDGEVPLLPGWACLLLAVALIGASLRLRGHAV